MANGYVFDSDGPELVDMEVLLTDEGLVSVSLGPCYPPVYITPMTAAVLGRALLREAEVGAEQVVNIVRGA